MVALIVVIINYEFVNWTRVVARGSAVSSHQKFLSNGCSQWRRVHSSHFESHPVCGRREAQERQRDLQRSLHPRITDVTST